MFWMIQKLWRICPNSLIWTTVRRQAETSTTPLPPLFRRATYTALTPGWFTCTCTWTVFRRGTAEKPLHNGPSNPFLSTYHYAAHTYIKLKRFERIRNASWRRLFLCSCYGKLGTQRIKESLCVISFCVTTFWP